MVNSVDFASRLEKIFDFYEISASTFAEAIDVGRSSISHILSGRNKPSLDFVMKVVSTYNEVDLYWLLNGKGTFPKGESKESSSTAQSSFKFDNPKDVKSTAAVKQSDAPQVAKEMARGSLDKKTISRIIILYADGSFESYDK